MMFFKYKRYDRWHPWFAWYPACVDGGFYWLEWVERRENPVYDQVTCTHEWEYRKKEEE